MEKDKAVDNTGKNNLDKSPLTQIPGVNNTHVIASSPNMIKENSQTSSPKKK